MNPDLDRPPVTFRHAVTFNRERCSQDEELAKALLVEWAAARGLAPALSEWEKRCIRAGDMRLAVIVREDDFGAWGGYAMNFAGEPHAATRETRLKGEPRQMPAVIAGYEEYWDPCQ